MSREGIICSRCKKPSCGLVPLDEGKQNSIRICRPCKKKAKAKLKNKGKQDE